MWVTWDFLEERLGNKAGLLYRLDSNRSLIIHSQEPSILNKACVAVHGTFQHSRRSVHRQIRPRVESIHPRGIEPSVAIFSHEALVRTLRIMEESPLNSNLEHGCQL